MDEEKENYHPIILDGKVASEFFTPQQAEEYLRLDMGQVHQLIAANKIPYYNLNQTFRLSRSELDNWIERTVKTGKV